ncbi:MAG: hypothetical protein Q9170_002572 [Blastenia crenularia]
MTTVHFLTLPNEILEAVCSHLPVGALLNVSLTCKILNIVAQPLLYRNIRLSPKPRRKQPDGIPDWANDPPETESIQRFWSLVSTLSTLSVLRNHVQSLFLIGPCCQDWHESFEDQNRLVSLLPRLRSLHLEPPPTDLDLTAHDSLMNLSLNFGCSNAYDDEVAHARSSLELLSKQTGYPSLRSLKVSWRDLLQPSGGDLFPNDRSRTSSITSLTLKINEGETIGAMPELLRSIKALQSLTFVTTCAWTGDETVEHELSPRLFSRSISHHASSLVELIIACNICQWFPRTTMSGTLATFPCLKCLGIPETYLASRGTRTFDSILPLCLESLQLQYVMDTSQGYDNECGFEVERLMNLIKERDLKLPFFKRFIWWYQQDGSLGWKTYRPISAILELNKIFRSYGVEFDYRNTAYYKDTPFARNESSFGVEQEYICGYSPF